MSNALFESISQGSGFEETAENRRIHEIANELRRCCQLYEAELRGSQKNVSRFGVGLFSLPTPPPTSTKAATMRRPCLNRFNGM